MTIEASKSVADIIYDSEKFREMSRGDAEQELASIVLDWLPESDRLSNGLVVDALLSALNMIADSGALKKEGIIDDWESTE